MSKKYYYDIEDDLKQFPEAWCFLIIGGRNTGKTYSALWYQVKEKEKFCFIKRTIEDVDILTAGSGRLGTKKKEYSIDLSPFKAINRDKDLNIKAFSIQKGLGGFWDCRNEEETPEGLPVGYLIALNAISKFKGFDLSDCDSAIFDEFIPQPWDRVNKKEGEQLLDLYKTISRDREHRNKKPLKLICLANATSISNPVMNILEVTDIVANMQVTGQELLYIEERGIVIHIIKDNKAFREKEYQSPIYKAMGQTAWGQMAFENTFAYNDLTSIGKKNLKGYRPLVTIQHKRDFYYCYIKEGNYYFTKSKNDKAKVYNLNRENDQKLFYLDYCLDIREACIEGRAVFETYTMYDLIVNYKKFFVL